ncbi:MAG: glycosyl hydrolase [Candidatus Nanoarchaeia archaeon]|nr:glycosyl hydrolase [Candidatus Jingweiarchaeum tengchongense]MCW1309700.1 glycosyl hydrolase [Candidatus Jingweiarchaeum tengchongense]
MLQLNKKWNLYVIHHSHTDVGYTDRQERIEEYHADFIRQAVEILNKIHSGEEKAWKGFKWNCEGFWGVEQFLKFADSKLLERFEYYVKNGDIGISANYLNLTELINFDVLKDEIKKAFEYGESLRIKLDSAMTADINGYSWGYADALLDNGVENLFSCIHTHHGMFPLTKQRPFWWEGQSGNKLLVWIGEHYMFGNELGLIEGQEFSYMIHDESKPQNKKEIEERTRNRILGYLQQLESENYPYDFVPVMVSGVLTDNAPPNGKIMDFINKWDEKNGDVVNIKMVTLSEFFKILRSQRVDIPTYKGDWTDWWADGMGSTPGIVKLFRDAQRKWVLCKTLDPENKFGDKKIMAEVANDLTLYSEHTWGYSASVLEPWDTMTNIVDLRKSAYAINAHEKIYRNFDKIMKSKSEVLVNPDMPLTFKVINSFDHKISDLAKLYIYDWERIGDVEVIEEKSGKVLPSQVDRVARGLEVNVFISLDAKEEKILVIHPLKTIEQTILVSNTPLKGAEGIYDFKSIFDCESLVFSPSRIESPFFRLEYKINEGITSWIDKTDGTELLREDRKYNAFTPIYEVTPVTTNIVEERRRMGRNRNNFHTKRYQGRLINADLISSGNLFLKAKFEYEIKGTKYFALIITAYKDIPRVDISLRINKESVWEPENLYVALPFRISPVQTLWIEKTGCILRPGIDQIPGTNMDFYCIQDGLSYISKQKGLIVATPDVPLIHLGTLEKHEIELCNGNDIQHNDDQLYSWLMNNFWETNFKATTGGFYEFNYHISCSKEFSDPQEAIQSCKMMNTGVQVVRIKKL